MKLIRFVKLLGPPVLVGGLHIFVRATLPSPWYLAHILYAALASVLLVNSGERITARWLPALALPELFSGQWFGLESGALLFSLLVMARLFRTVVHSQSIFNLLIGAAAGFILFQFLNQGAIFIIGILTGVGAGQIIFLSPLEFSIEIFLTLLVFGGIIFFLKLRRSRPAPRYILGAARNR
jgi:hypothetical protein